MSWQLGIEIAIQGQCLVALQTGQPDGSGVPGEFVDYAGAAYDWGDQANGQNLTLTLSVINTGDATAPAVEVVESTFPGGLTLPANGESQDIAPGDSISANQEFPWSLPADATLDYDVWSVLVLAPDGTPYGVSVYLLRNDADLQSVPAGKISQSSGCASMGNPTSPSGPTVVPTLTPVPSGSTMLPILVILGAGAVLLLAGLSRRR